MLKEFSEAEGVYSDAEGVYRGNYCDNGNVMVLSWDVMVLSWECHGFYFCAKTRKCESRRLEDLEQIEKIT